jgi:hypothetical protein
MSEIAVFYYPIKELGEGEYLALTLNNPTYLEVGTEIDLLDHLTNDRVEGLRVVAGDTFPLDDLPEGILDVLDVPSVQTFVASLENIQGYTLPVDTQVTVYRLSDESELVLDSVLAEDICRDDEDEND